MRVRFAPSPTGFLHIGNARTAIINYLIARKTGAAFVLRIEDTDLERSSAASEQSIMSDLRWLGISWDEGPDCGGGHGPYRQSERFDIYRTYTERLIAEGSAYPCYCTKEELDEMKKAEGGQFEYNGRCRSLTPAERTSLEAEGRAFTVRFRVPAGQPVTVNDHLKGPTVFNSDNIGGDFIIVRSDGVPVYNYIVVIDDALMAITHVIRGEDHLSNTPKQVLIGRALKLPEPEYAHLPLVLGPDRSKLSKRHGITSVDLYRSEGYLPGALVNYLGLLGWAPEDGKEILPMDELVRQIDLDHLGKSAAVFDFQKLRWMNGIYIREYPLDAITDLFIPFIEKAGYTTSGLDRGRLEQIVALLRGNCEVLGDIAGLVGIFLDDVPEPDADAAAILADADTHKILAAARQWIDGAPDDDAAFFAALVAHVGPATGLKGKKLFMPVRAMITGRQKGPELDKAMPLIGTARAKKRIVAYHDRFK